MRQIAIVEDNPNDAEILKRYVDRFVAETGELCKVTFFKNGIDFVSTYKSEFDIVFMDIEMPFIDGMETARKLRELDEYVSLIFVTNMAKFAINGYEVGALDFILKPVAYFTFSDKLKKAFSKNRRKQEKEITLSTVDGQVLKIPISDVYYLEKDKNYIIFHTKQGNYRQRGTMKKMEEIFLGSGFSKNMTGFLVNLSHIVKTTRTSVIMQEQELPISRQQRKEFMEDILRYFGG